jgi:hypothetical protein
MPLRKQGAPAWSARRDFRLKAEATELRKGATGALSSVDSSYRTRGFRLQAEGSVRRRCVRALDDQYGNGAALRVQLQPELFLNGRF